jgi:peptide-methionine (S)-S-oxide reductase
MADQIANMKFPMAVLAFSFGMLLSCNQNNNSRNMITTELSASLPGIEGRKVDTATLANGCFWCTEAIFQQLDGVLKVSSGYMGGHVVNPTYKEVCEGTTGHAECIQIVYDPEKITYDELLEVFWQTHDPTTLNRQGNDVGPQYRSEVFYHNEEQKQKAIHYKNELEKSKAFDKPIVTAISPASTYYVAENYHQDYYNLNGSQPYCYYVIRPKLEKFKKAFKEKMKH